MVKPSGQLVIKNGSTEAVHFRITPLASPTAKEKLTYAARHAEFWLTCIATWAIHGIQINGNRGFVAVCHKEYVGNRVRVVKVRDTAGGTLARAVHLADRV